MAYTVPEICELRNIFSQHVIRPPEGHRDDAASRERTALRNRFKRENGDADRIDECKKGCVNR